MSKFNAKVEAAIEALETSAALYSSKLEDTLGRAPGYERDQMIDERTGHLTLGYLRTTLKRVLAEIEHSNPELFKLEMEVLHKGFQYSIANLDAEKEVA